LLSVASALPVGPSDWHRDVIPLEEYSERIVAARAILKSHGIDGLLVPGSVVRHGAFVYLTGYTPKLQPAFALMSAAGTIRILYSGPPGMRPSVARQTWIDDLRPAGPIERDLLLWTRELRPSGPFALGLWDGQQLSVDDEASIRRAIGKNGRIEDLSDQLDGLPRRKNAVERRIIRNTAKLIAPAIDAIHADLIAGQTIRRAILAGERSAYSQGAQEVRILASNRPGGMPIAFDVLPESSASSINLYLAVRSFGYWVEAHATVGEMTAAANQAALDLDEVMLCLRRFGVVDKALSGGLRCHGIGLNLMESPQFVDRIALQEGDVCSIVVERSSGKAFGFASALVLAEDNELKTVWSIGDGRASAAALSK
jgi:hypothetical protein